MVFKVYANQNSELTKVLVTAKYAGINVEVASGDITPELLAKNPTGKVPTLETSEGVIFESNAIVRFLARSGEKANLYGKSAFEAGLIEQWIDFAASSIDLAASAWTLPIEGLIANNALATKKAGEEIKKVFQILDSHLSTRTYLVGNRVSVADVVVASSLVRLFELVLDPAFRGGFVNATRWFTTIVNQPNFASVKKVTLADKVAVAEKPKKAEKPKVEQAPKPAKAEQPKKEAKPAADDEEESYADEDDKKKNPLDALPKSSFILDEWKRVYSNKDTRGEALPWFHANQDPAGYSLFWATYKYNDELPAQVFMINNLVGGYFQRLEKLHKYAFGTMNIYGESGNWNLSGVWLFRGSDIPPEMLACDDTEHYTWTRVNLADATEKAKFDDYLAWEGSVDGKAFNTGKVFK